MHKMAAQLDAANARVKELQTELQTGIKVEKAKCQEALIEQRKIMEGEYVMRHSNLKTQCDDRVNDANAAQNLLRLQFQNDMEAAKQQLQAEEESCEKARGRAAALEQQLHVKSPRDCTAPEVLAQYEAYEKQLSDLKKRLDKCEKAKNQKQPGSPKASHKGDIEKTCGIMAVRDTVVDGLKHNIGLDENATDPVQKALYLLHKARKNDIGDRLLALLQLLLQLVKNLKADLPLDHTQVTSACAEMSLKLLQYEEVFGQATAETKEIQQMQAERKLSMSAVIKSIPGGRTWQPHR